jgi:hypothetical protein
MPRRALSDHMPTLDHELRLAGRSAIASSIIGQAREARDGVGPCRRAGRDFRLGPTRLLFAQDAASSSGRRDFSCGGARRRPRQDATSARWTRLRLREVATSARRCTRLLPRRMRLLVVKDTASLAEGGDVPIGRTSVSSRKDATCAPLLPSFIGREGTLVPAQDGLTAALFPSSSRTAHATRKPIPSPEKTLLGAVAVETRGTSWRELGPAGARCNGARDVAAHSARTASPPGCRRQRDSPP